MSLAQIGAVLDILLEWEKGTAESMLELPPNSELGDAAFPCFALAKSLRKAPQQIASDLAERFELEGTEATAAGPYLNFRLDRSLHSAALLVQAEGQAVAPKGETVVIDMSSPNIAKPFGVGHLRSTVIGAALYRMYAEAGYHAISVNHLGDWGTQFGKQITAYKRWGSEERLKAAPIRESLSLYVRFHDEAESDPTLETEARDWFRRLESGDAEALGLWRYFVDVSLSEFDRMYERLGVSFDKVLGESFYNDKMGAVVDELRAEGLLEESEGAQVVRLDEADMPPCLILKSDGTTIYPTRDLATAIYRHDVLEADKLLYVVGAEQTLHFRQVFAVLHKMGRDWASACRHIPFGLMKFEGKKMSTRKGKVVFLEEVLDEAVARAAAIIEEKNPQLQNRDAVAEAIGIGAIVFGDLKNNRIGEINFSIEEAVQFEGETGPYVQYTHARARSVLRKAKAEGIEVNEGTADLGMLKREAASYEWDEASWELLKRLCDHQTELHRGIQRHEPSTIARYALDLAKLFNRFYHHNKVLSAAAGDKEIRLELTRLAAERLRWALNLLGVRSPEEI
ncbi:arginine--tRNA ligase [Saccharibacillus sacchari]|uniref:Arginine--tRNA ligase n=1 Tax=Saccharibacillus sacchari DSM 19268 TaxID=915437 RepID=A0A011AM53_9BACL|nr:arginine--tRNA ligase [Saccharibacillus sacchari]EXG83051.1 arginyl-tRNA synthetase [Saccharibacillus sacchari DSM 19268]